MKLPFFVILCFLLTACVATKPDPIYLAQLDAYAEAQKHWAEAAKEKYKADAERYRAVGLIASTGDSVAKVAAVLSLAGLSGAQANLEPRQEAAPQFRPAETWEDKIFKWTGLVLNPAVSVYGIAKQTNVAMRQSDNARDTALANYQAFGTIASSGFNAASTIATSGFNATGSIANAGFAAVRDVAVNAKPTITVTNGAVSTGAGNATYTTTTHTNSHNRQCQGGNAAPGGNGGNGAGTGAGGAGGSGAPGGAAGC